ncbi:MAG: outer membrane beta-barrel protein [Candidatus Acidiferrales bacterium]
MEPNRTSNSSHTVTWQRKNLLAALVTFALLLIAAPAARAQNTNVGSINVDYSYLRADSSGNGGVFSAVGGTIMGGFDIRGPLSIVGEVQGYSFQGQPVGTKGQMLIYVFGPELQVPIHHSPISVSADVLFGGGYLRGEESGQVASSNAFVFDFGPGLIANVRDRWSIQIVKVEYLMTNFARNDGAAGRQNDMRISAGFTFNFQRRRTYH